MNDETEESMRDTFSFFDVLEGRTYPTDEVTICIDEAAGYDLDKITREANALEEPTEEIVAELKARADVLAERIENARFTFHLRGVSDDRVTEAKEVADAEFSPKRKQRKSAAGNIEKYLPEEEALKYARFFNAVVVALHVERIVSHGTGKVMTAPSPDEMAHFLDKAPEAAKYRLSAAIQALRVDSNAYEATLDEGFFLRP